MSLIQELFGQGILNEKSRDELEAEVKNSGKTEEEVISERRIVSEESLFDLKSKILKIPIRKVKTEDVSLDVLGIIPEEAAINYKMAPLSKKDNVIEVGMVYPEDILAQNSLRFLSRQENFVYKTFLITFSDLANLLKQYRNLKSEAKKALSQLDKDKKDLLKGIQVPIAGNIMAEDAPIIKMVQAFLRDAIEGNASDIHIEPSREKLNIRFRRDGILHPSLFLPLSIHPAIVARVKIISGLKIDENRLPQDGRFSAKINNRDVDFRVSTFPSINGEKVEIRVLDPAEGLKSFEELGLRGRSFEIVKNAIKKPYGLILSTGPTGSGKTTTLYALMRILNKDDVNIVTIEDPVEYSIAGVNQSQTKPEIGYTFSNGLRQILRQDPNIIMVGEIRDEETASLTINAALTGHLVFSSLHTNSTAGVIPRLIDMGIRPFLIPSTLKVAISQRLVRMLCKSCRQKIRPNIKITNYIENRVKSFAPEAKREVKIPEPLYIYQAKGCEKCGFTGYTGRTGLFEVLQMTDELAELVSKNPLESMIFKIAQKQGMLSMEQEGILRVLEGETTLEELTRVTEEKN